MAGRGQGVTPLSRLAARQGLVTALAGQGVTPLIGLGRVVSVPSGSACSPLRVLVWSRGRGVVGWSGPGQLAGCGMPQGASDYGVVKAGVKAT